uniref:Ig-like domain-containing protein n=1 Tax=Spermophilus dauricus TaxID=99837 RepID=A0A8C9PD55_SPEDA
IFTLFILFIFIWWNAAVSLCTSPPRMVNGILGKSVTLLLNFPADKKANVISWNHNGINVAYMHLNELGELQYMVPFKNWKERLNFTQTYSLHLSNLTMTDAGSYEAQINTEPSPTVSCYTLRIFRPLSNLQVTHHTQLSGNSTCEIHLTCSLENPNDTVSFGWKFSENSSLREPNLTISWDPMSSSEQNYTCIAENPVSNLSFSVTAQSLCTGNSQPQVSLRALSNCGVCHVLHTLQDSQNSGSGRQTLTYSLFYHIAFPKNIPMHEPLCLCVSQMHMMLFFLQEMKIPAPTKQDSITIYSTINHSKEVNP